MQKEEIKNNWNIFIFENLKYIFSNSLFLVQVLLDFGVYWAFEL